MRRLLAGLVLALVSVALLLPVTASAAVQKVYVLRVDEFQPVDAGLAQHARRVFEQAEADPNAVAVAVVVDTPGGLVKSAFDINDLMLNSKLRTVSWVKGRALSAGALIAMAGEKLYMNAGSSIGAAEPRTQGANEPADQKTLSAVVGTFRSTAQARGRDPKIAAAMVDRAAKLPGQDTDLLTLTYRDALDRNFADGEAATLEDALRLAGIAQFQLVEAEWTLRERIGRFLTSPTVATLLLVAGIIAIAIEFMKPGITLPALVGVVCLGLFFAGNVMVGTAGWLEISLALIGAILLAIEAFVPGFGIFGIGGIIAIGASIFFAVPSPELAIQYIMYASVAFLVAMAALLRTVSKRGIGRALTLETSLGGVQPERLDRANLIGKLP